MRELLEAGGEFAQGVLLDALETARAWDAVHDANVTGGMDMDGYLELMKAAGYSQRTAEKAAAEHGLARLRRDLPL